MFRKFSKMVMASFLAIGISALSFPVYAAEQPIQIKIGSPAPETLPFIPAFHEMANFIEKESNGKYQVTVYPQYKLGTISTEMQGLQMGTIHFVHDGTNNIAQFIPLLGAFDYPYVFSNMEQVNHIFSGDFEKRLMEKVSNKNLKCLGFANSTLRNMLTTKPAKNLDDIRKMKIRVTSSKVHVNSIKGMGISVTPMPFSEVYTGIQQGVVEGLDLDYPYIASMRLYEVAPYALETNHMYSPQVLYTGVKWWNSLPEEDRKMFEKAVQLWLEKSDLLLEEELERSKQQCIDGGTTIRTIDEAELARWQEAAKPSYEMMTPAQKELYNEIQTELKSAGLKK